MELVSVATNVGVGNVGEAMVSSNGVSQVFPQDALRACLQQQVQRRVDTTEDDFDDDCNMDAEDGPYDPPQSPVNDPKPDEDLDDGPEQMDFDESRSERTFLEDEDSSRAFVDGDDDIPPSSSPAAVPSHEGRRNKRKNFKPRNIVYFPDSDENTDNARDSAPSPDFRTPVFNGAPGPLDLSDPGVRMSLLQNRMPDVTGSNPHLNALLNRGGPWEAEGPSAPDPSVGLKEYAERTMRRLLGLYGLGDAPNPSLPASLISGKLMENLNGADGSVPSNNGPGEPPTPPHTPQVENPHQDNHTRNSAEALQSRLFGDQSFTALLTLAAIQENKGGGVPLPATLDPSKCLSGTPSTSTSPVVTPGLAGLTLGNMGPSPSLVHGGISVRDSLGKQTIDYTRYVKRFSSALECGNPACRELNHREHFHCLDCSSKVFSKKEEMIRHFKWHKKRDESLQHGFMRYSSTDDCSDRFTNCSHNKKQTHYHCLKESCDKVYISTSDVQMHANYHRKDSAIMQEGFQRFRASEDCNDPTCPFSGQRTTHFHCMRSGCNFTFKNKADMEKHKTYHIKDEQLTKDGFKKFMKQEDCGYDGCKLSKISNHIHCIRTDCHYVLHSSGQIFAHKRKHERQDHEKAYRKYKLAQSMLGVPEPPTGFSPLLHDALRPLTSFPSPMMGSFAASEMDDSSSSVSSSQVPPSLSSQNLPRPSPFLMGGFPPGMVDSQHPLARLLSVPPPAAHSFFPGTSQVTTPTTSTSSASGPASPVDLSVGGEEGDWEKNIRYFSRDESCRPDCELSAMDHWHCDECEALFHTRENAKEHGKAHEQQTIVTEENYMRVNVGESTRCPPDCQILNQADHFHCTWEGCSDAFLVTGEKPFRRLEHFRIHDFARRLPVASPSAGGSGMTSVTSIESMFKRKRGRPPKNRIIEVWNGYLPVSSSHDSPQAIFTSFKLPKNSTSPPHGAISPSGLPSGAMLNASMNPLTHLAHMSRSDLIGAPLTSVPPLSQLLMPNVVKAPPSVQMIPLDVPLTVNPQQTNAQVVEGFYCWEENTVCPDQLCPELHKRHYHCSHPQCFFVTVSPEEFFPHNHDVHESPSIPDGFIFIDRTVNCRMTSCQSNKVTKHFHCTKCGLSFCRTEAVEAHVEKHAQEGSSGGSHSLGPLSPIYLQKPRPESPMETPSTNGSPCSTGSADTPSKSQVIKSSGIFYPLSPFPLSHQGAVRSLVTSTENEPGALVTAIPPSSKPSAVKTFTLPVSTSMTITRHSPLPPPAFSPVKEEQMDQDDPETSDQKQSPRKSSSPKPTAERKGFSEMLGIPAQMTEERVQLEEWQIQESYARYGPDLSCARPFCKLKKRDHFHCQICNQAFSEQDKVRPHLIKHMAGYSFPSSSSDAEENELDQTVKSVEENDEVSMDSKKDFRPTSPPSVLSSINNNVPGTFPIMTSAGPRLSIPGFSAHQPPSSFPSPLIYSQAAGVGFPGLPSPFPPPFGLSGIYPGGIPRLLPPGGWTGMHPALAAMTHPHLMLPQVRHNGDLAAQISQSGIGGLSPSVGGTSSLPSPGERSPILPSALNTSPHLAMLGKRLGADDFSMQEAKKIRASHSMRMLKDEPVPEGYVRFRFNEDCQHAHCGYREHQTHFHCLRKDCGYSFCDKTRFVQHTARHERLDTLMGGDFQQFRAIVPCGRPACAYSTTVGTPQNKASHFHCLKCDFVCTDTNKVVAHRRQHQKRDSINAAGFEKFTPSQPCGVLNCSHNQKQTHYHCLKCQYSVLGLSQMSAHKFRHME